MYSGVDVGVRESLVGRVRESVNALFTKPLQKSSDDVERQPEHQCHNADKCRYCGIFTGQERVYASASDVLLALLRLGDRLCAQPEYERETHIGYRCAAVETALLFELENDVLDELLLVPVNRKLLQNERIALDDLARGKPQRQSGELRVILDEVLHTVYAAVYRAAVGSLAAEVLIQRLFLILRNVQGVFHKLVDTRILSR